MIDGRVCDRRTETWLCSGTFIGSHLTRWIVKRVVLRLWFFVHHFVEKIVVDRVLPGTRITELGVCGLVLRWW